MTGTRDDIILLADSLIRIKGYNGFSYRDISAEMEVRNATIHHYFPTKSELGVAVIDRELQKILLNKELYKYLPGDEQLKKVVEIFYRTREKGQICLMGALTSDYCVLPTAMQAGLRRLSESLLEWVAACLEKARTEQRLDFQGESTDRALLFLSAMLSALLFSRVLLEDVFDRMADQLLNDMQVSWRVADMTPEHWMDL